MNPICSPESCSNRAHAKNLCSTHYKRLRDFGDVKESIAITQRTDTCSHPGCGLLVSCRGFCSKHYKRFRQFGDSSVVHENHFQAGNAFGPGQPFGSAHPLWRSDNEITYRAAHRRIRTVKGSASKYSCVKCDGTAMDWSYKRIDPAEKVDKEGRHYSVNPDFYEPLCRSCHKLFDGAISVMTVRETAITRIADAITFSISELGSDDLEQMCRRAAERSLDLLLDNGLVAPL